MCGIAGFSRVLDSTGDKSTLQQMGQAIVHRGPDASGTYIDDSIGLAHQRLAIIDLSDAGVQPMHYAQGQYIMVFNGEIYNYRELRSDLAARGVHFRTQTDSEVILALYQQMGADCVDKLNGMFAIAIWDTSRRELFLARDRLGKKPLYYYSDNKRFAFASEIKALLQIKNLQLDVRADAVCDFFSYHYVPEQKSIYKNIHKLAAGHFLLLDSEGSFKTQAYWNLSFARTRENSTPTQLVDELQTTLLDSVRSRMVSDVPLGAFLSGGIDSSAVVAMMAASAPDPVTTCAIGFDSEKYDEVVYAQQVAKIFGTRHFEHTVKENVENNLRHIARYFDEPFADSSFVPTYFVSKLARQNVTVALAGDGGDENFAGYSKYINDRHENSLRNLVPGVLRRALFPQLNKWLSNNSNQRLRQVASMADTLAHDPAGGFYLTNALVRDELWNDLCLPEFKYELNGYHSSRLTTDTYAASDAPDHLGKILYTDIKTYLPGDILVKVDRMSMANSLEVRAPLLDYRVVELAASIPSALKLKGTDKKHILKLAFADRLPHDILFRKKMGFAVPLQDWLRKEIREIAESYLFSNNTGLSNYLNMANIKALWSEHVNSKKNHSNILWSALMFEMWWQEYVERS